MAACAQALNVWLAPAAAVIPYSGVKRCIPEVTMPATASPEPPVPQSRRLLVSAVWALILLISDLPDVVIHGLGVPIPGWILWAKIAVLAAFLGLCLLLRRLRPLWRLGLVMLVFYLALAGTGRIRDTAWWRGGFGAADVSFTFGYLGIFLLDSAVALSVIGALWAVMGQRSRFFLARGQLDAAIRPVRWLGIKPGESWRTFGWIFAAVAGVGVAVPTFLGLRPTASVLLAATPLLPAVLLFAAVNAFNEEVYFRLSLLATLEEVIGARQALLVNVVLFGLAHYLYGSPPGVVGFLMTGFLAWLLGKAILETRGLAWAWFIHFVPDVVIFLSYALAWVRR